MASVDEWIMFYEKVASGTNIALPDDYTDTYYFYDLDGNFQFEIPREAIDAMDRASDEIKQRREEAYKEDRRSLRYIRD